MPKTLGNWTTVISLLLRQVYCFTFTVWKQPIFLQLLQFRSVRSLIFDAVTGDWAAIMWYLYCQLQRDGSHHLLAVCIVLASSVTWRHCGCPDSTACIIVLWRHSSSRSGGSLWHNQRTVAGHRPRLGDIYAQRMHCKLPYVLIRLLQLPVLTCAHPGLYRPLAGINLPARRGAIYTGVDCVQSSHKQTVTKRTMIADTYPLILDKLWLRISLVSSSTKNYDFNPGIC